MNIGCVCYHLFIITGGVFFYFACTLQLIPALICIIIGIILAVLGNKYDGTWIG